MADESVDETAERAQTQPQPPLPYNPEEVVTFVYTNWKGETSVRRVLPRGIVFESNEWHIKKQWLLYAWDLDKVDWRTFAIKNIRLPWEAGDVLLRGKDAGSVHGAGEEAL